MSDKVICISDDDASDAEDLPGTNRFKKICSVIVELHVE